MTDVPIEIQIVFQEKNVISARIQAFLQCEERGTDLSLIGSFWAGSVEMNMERRVAPIGLCEIFQGLSPNFVPFRTGNHHRLNFHCPPDSLQIHATLPAKIRTHPPIPGAPQIGQVKATLLFQPKTVHPLIEKKVPFGHVSMLKNAPSGKVMLTHGPFQCMDRLWDKGIRRLQFAKSQMKCFFISMQIPIKKVGILVDPHGKTKRRPTS